MTRETKVRVLTAVVLTIALGAGLARKARRAQTEAADPQDAVYAMLQAARAGNVKAYLSSHTGQMEATLRRMLSETTEADFAARLRESNADIKGVAVSDTQVNGRTASAKVEYVYQDRNEQQTVYLEKASAGWKIARADNEDRIKTLIPYGTPVK